MQLLRPPRGAGLSAWLAYQETLHPRSIELGLQRVAEVARRLELTAAIGCTLTVGGTNGKGSSATLASLVYREAGYRVGLFTSPHLLRYSERIAIDGHEAEEAALCAAFEDIETARGDIQLTYFEFGTLAALLLFARAAVDVQVLEVGLGGRLDAVNLVDADAALVTSIGLDHLDWLGPDRDSVGREKAGIFRAGRPAICAESHPPVTIGDHARELGADLCLIGRDFNYEVGDSSWSWQGRQRVYAALPLPGLGGSAQLSNASGVLAAVEALQPLRPVDEAAIHRALPRLQLPGRFERRGRVILDVAHNAEAAAVLAERLRTLPGPGRAWLVLGMLSDKPVEAVCAALAPCVVGAIFAGLPPPRGIPAPELQRRAAAAGLSGLAANDPAAALALAMTLAAPEDFIVVCGSFLTVADVAARLEAAG